MGVFGVIFVVVRVLSIVLWLSIWLLVLRCSMDGRLWVLGMCLVMGLRGFVFLW